MLDKKAKSGHLKRQYTGTREFNKSVVYFNPWRALAFFISLKATSSEKREKSTACTAAYTAQIKIERDLL